MSAPLPEWSRQQCPKCFTDIAYVRTSKVSKGEPVELAVDFEPDTGNGGTVAVQKTGNVLYGNPVPKTQAVAMRAAGVRLHAQHSTSCQKRSTSHRTT